MKIVSIAFVCTECRANKMACEAKKGSITSKGTGKCKSCHADREKLTARRKKVEKYPHLYLDCDTCDNAYGRQYLKCPYCELDVNALPKSASRLMRERGLRL